jgi:serine/threonine-protein kinase
VLYEMLAGDPPHSAGTAQAIIAKVLTEKPRSLRLARDTVPPHVERAVARALEKLPADRFANAAELAAALRGESGAGRASPGIVAPARAGRPRLVPALGGALAVALGAGAWGWMRPRPTPPPVVRAAIDVGDLLFMGPLSLSPDGSRLAIVARQPGEAEPRVFVKRIGDEEFTPVPGAVRAYTVEFSPDGRWLAFLQTGAARVMKVAADGGTAEPLGVAGSDIDGASRWGPAGDVVAVRQGQLYHADRSAGRPTPLGKVDSASGGRYQNPRHAPDGRSMIVSRLESGRRELVVVDVIDGSVTPLGVPGSAGFVVHAGYLVYLDESAIRAVRFDVRRRRVSGEPRVIADGLPPGTGLVVAPTGEIAYVTVDSRGSELVLVDRSGRAEPVPLPPANYRFPRFSPDGQRLAFNVSLSLGGDLWTYDLASRRALRLTADSASSRPEWTPDGRSLLFVRGDGGGNPMIHRVPADGSSEAAPRFARAGSKVWEARLTPDGRLVFREDVPRGIRDILVAPLDSPAAARPLAATASNERGIALSPDGRWLAFSSDRSGTDEIYLRRLDPESPTWRVSTHGGVEPRWGGGSAGARELFFRLADSVFVVPVALAAAPALGEPRRLFSGRYVGTGHEPFYDVSPDGRRFVFVRPAGGEDRRRLHLVLNWFARPGARGGARE